MQQLIGDTLLNCITNRWSPTIGDPTILGWATVWLYGIAACAAFVVSFSPRTRSMQSRARIFWALTAILLTVLAVNKQLDLQSALTAFGRCISQAQGWYDQRRSFQRNFIFVLIAVSLVALVVILYWLRNTWRQTGLAALGIVFVMAFVLVRAIGFHHVDALINIRIIGARMNVVLEWTGPILILIAALKNYRQSNPSGRSSRHDVR